MLLSESFIEIDLEINYINHSIVFVGTIKFIYKHMYHSFSLTHSHWLLNSEHSNQLFSVYFIHRTMGEDFPKAFDLVVVGTGKITTYCILPDLITLLPQVLPSL